MSFGLVSVLSALEHRDRTGQGQCVDLSQYEALLMFVQPALLETQVTGKTPPRAGNRDPRFCPQGVYPVQGEDQWVALTVRSGAEWRALLGLLPAASRGALSGLDALAERNARADAIDAEIAAWSRAFDGSELAERLQAAGIAAYPVNTGPMLLADPQLAARGHYTWPEHPMIGKIPVDGPPFRLDALELDVRPGPMYGTHSFAVLNEWLGVEADEFANLMAAGVVLAE
jgi:benzylsuccinate CoA-transferase BbsF subunit